MGVKRLLLMRHAKAVPGDFMTPDFDRPLASRGHDDARHMTSFLMKQGVMPQHIFSSSAQRTQETTAHLVEKMELSSDKVHFSETLYLAPALVYLDVFKKLDDDVDCVMLVGHNPGISQLVAYLTGDVVDLKTAGVADVAVNASWSTVEQGDLKHIWFPKFID